jgi:hypothetical protein
MKIKSNAAKVVEEAVKVTSTIEAVSENRRFLSLSR